MKIFKHSIEYNGIFEYEIHIVVQIQDSFLKHNFGLLRESIFIFQVFCGTVVRISYILNSP